MCVQPCARIVLGGKSHCWRRRREYVVSRKAKKACVTGAPRLAPERALTIHTFRLYGPDTGLWPACREGAGGGRVRGAVSIVSAAVECPPAGSECGSARIRHCHWGATASKTSTNRASLTRTPLLHTLASHAGVTYELREHPRRAHLSKGRAHRVSRRVDIHCQRLRLAYM